MLFPFHLYLCLFLYFFLSFSLCHSLSSLSMSLCLSIFLFICLSVVCQIRFFYVLCFFPCLFVCLILFRNFPVSHLIRIFKRLYVSVSQTFSPFILIFCFTVYPFSVYPSYYLLFGSRHAFLCRFHSYDTNFLTISFIEKKN
jgi:hypothetical protein